MVKAAYSSGTPAYGVGAGNVVTVVDQTADYKDSAHKIMLSKTFDLATSCSADNNIVLEEAVYDDMLAALKAEGAYLATADDKEKLKETVWHNGVLSRDIVAQEPLKIAELAGIVIPEDTKFILVEEDGCRP